MVVGVPFGSFDLWLVFETAGFVETPGFVEAAVFVATGFFVAAAGVRTTFGFATGLTDVTALSGVAAGGAESGLPAAVARLWLPSCEATTSAWRTGRSCSTGWPESLVVRPAVIIHAPIASAARRPTSATMRIGAETCMPTFWLSAGRRAYLNKREGAVSGALKWIDQTLLLTRTDR